MSRTIPILTIASCLLSIIGLASAQPTYGSNCDAVKKTLDPKRHKTTYTVGVLAIRGFEAAYQEFNRTFSDYLTVTAGQRFDPPVTFDMKPLDFISLFEDTEASLVDFIYVNPSAFSCIESEYTAQSLVSQISRRNVGGNIYNLKKFGGVIFRRADNDEIQTIHDLKDKIIAAASISGLGSGQMQFLEMKNAGMSYINDPKQLVFTSNQGKVVEGVLNGLFDVGFVRTDQLERSKDADGNPIDTSLFKIINTQSNLTVDGEPFPFDSSTPLYPEWNVAALSHVPEDISRYVQEAMLELADHAQMGSQLVKCQESFDEAECTSLVLSNATVCTSRYVALVAEDARTKGKYSGWQTTLSYMQLRSMQEATGMISQDPETLTWHCVRSTELYDAITCPSGFYKEAKSDVDIGCFQKGLECEDGFQCVCNPCVPIVTCDNGVELGDNCVSYAVLLPAILVPLFLFALTCVHFYVEHKHKQADTVWVVKLKELIFSDPPEVIGMGTFGKVLLAEYRGTKVAVKKVIPPQSDTETIRSAMDDSNLEAVEEGRPGHRSVAFSPGIQSMPYNPGLESMVSAKDRKRASRTGLLSRIYHKRSHQQLKKDFVREMRHLAKLRHPNITTVMGAVVSRNEEPMLVMEYMSHGSLYDAMRNEAINAELEESILNIVQDIAHGLRFLHSANPQVIHGDLKAKNVLIDSSFRAKVCDFGLSAKKQVGAQGTPYWMAPELLSGKSSNTAMSDIYAFGILLYEVYSSGKDPYEGEDYEEVLRLVCDPNVNKRPPVPPSCPAQVAEIMQECLLCDPQDRPVTEQVDLRLRVEGNVQRRVSRLETLNRELEQANEKISSAQAMQLEHFACMSHEIRTPLNCIIGISSLMEEDEELALSHRDSVKMIVSSGKLLRCVIDDVLDYSKLESGKAEIEIKRTNLQNVVTNLVNSMVWSSVTQRKIVSIRTFYDPLLTKHVFTDGRRLQQILYNLLSNAVKYSRPKGVVDLSVSICSTDERRISEEEDSSAASQQQSVIRFVVEDHGKGIEKKEFENIFQPFTQTNSGINNTDNTDGGTGLGLAITKQLVERLGGSISVDSQVGQWTKFTVDFPFKGSVADAQTLSSKLASCAICLVGDQKEDIKYISDACGHFNVDHQHFATMKELDENLKFPCPDRTYVCLVQGTLYNEAMYDSLSKRLKTILVLTGPDTKADHSQGHYPCLTNVFPSVLMEELGTLCLASNGRRRLSKALSIDSDLDLGSAAHLEHLKILIAEDNKVNQKVLVRLLKRLGITNVQVAENGQIAVDLEAAESFDIVLMDMQMPVMDGIEACKLILARPESPRPKVIFVSAHVSEEFRALCIENGASDYLSKPCTIKDLRRKLEKALDDES